MDEEVDEILWVVVLWFDSSLSYGGGEGKEDEYWYDDDGDCFGRGEERVLLLLDEEEGRRE